MSHPIARLLPLCAVLVLSHGLAGLAAAAGDTPRDALVDGRGRSIDIRKTPLHVISGSLASDEVVFELLQRTVHLERIAALSSLADDPRYSNIAPVPDAVKGRFGGALESALKLKPDLAILASYNKPETLTRLEQAGVRTYVIRDFTTLDDVASNVTAIGRLLHEDRPAAQWCEEFTRELARLRKNAARLATPPKVLQFFPDGTVSGAGTLFDEIVRAAGGENLAATRGFKGWQRLGSEALVTMRPDWIVATGDAKERDGILAILRQTPGWRTMDAVRDGRVVVISGATLSAVSPHVVGAIAALQKALVDGAASGPAK